MILEAGGRGEPEKTAQASASAVATALVVGSLFVPQVIEGFYLGIHRELPEAFPFLGAAVVVMSVTAWFWSYSKAHRISWVTDMGWFLFGAWVIFVPYHILQAEGRRGWSRIGLFGLTWFAAWATGWATSIWSRLLLGGQ